MNIGMHVYHLEDIDDDTTFRMIALNSAAEIFTGVTRANSVGKTIDENFPGLRTQGIPQLYAEIVRSKKPIEFGDILYGDERVKKNWFTVRAFPLPDNCVGISFDKITERKLMENELKAHREHLEEKVKERTAELIQEKMMAETANRAKSVFIGSMSHELRTPLNAILGFSQLLIEDPLLSSQHNEKLKSINKNAEQLLKLLNKIIDISKIESDITTTTLSTFHLKPLLDNIENIFRQKALSKRLEFSLEQSQKIPEFIETDKDKLQQILFNLLDNAVKFTKKGTIQLRISVSRLEQDKVTLFFVVEDSGSGIAGDEIDKIFEPFYRPEKNKNLSGTGLGLALSKEFCTLLGGTILVQSEIKKGSLFTASIVVNEKYKLSIIEQCDEQETKKNADYHLPLTADDLQTVPYKLVVEIISSIKKLDQEMLLESVGKITEISADFCQQLKVMARGYQYDKLISLFEERRGNHE